MTLFSNEENCSQPGSVWYGQAWPTDDVTPEFYGVVTSVFQEELNKLEPERQRRILEHTIEARPVPSVIDLKETGTPPGATLLGLWRSYPLNITLFEGSVRARAKKDNMTLEESVRDTMEHEMKHAFGWQHAPPNLFKK